VPHGLVYRVARNDGRDVGMYQDETLEHLKALPDWRGVDVVSKYVKGSWEYAAVSVANDGRYQAALGFLTYGLEIGKQVGSRPELLGNFVNSLWRSSDILYGLVEQRFGMALDEEGGCAKPPLSFPTTDLTKNAALSFMKLFTAVDVFSQFKEEEFGNWVRSGGISLEDARRKTREVIQLYLKDVATVGGDGSERHFKAFLKDLK